MEYRDGWSLRGTLQRDDWQMSTTFVEVNLQREPIARLSSDQCLRLGAGGRARQLLTPLSRVRCHLKTDNPV